MRIAKSGNNIITTTELSWIAQALNAYISTIKSEMEEAPDSEIVQSLGKITIDGRNGLITKINDIVHDGYKTVKIV